MSKHELSLENLTGYQFDKRDVKLSMAKIRAKIDFYKSKYGDNWRDEYEKDSCLYADYDVTLRLLNESIYCGRMVDISGATQRAVMFPVWYEQRMRELYGKDYDLLKNHAMGDSRVVELLLQDALKTGKWKELPEVLHDLYKDRVVGG